MQIARCEVILGGLALPIVNRRLNCGMRRPYFVVVLIGALAFARTASAIQPSDPNPTSGLSAADAEVPRRQVHLSAQAMQAIYLNGFRLGAQKAARSAKVTSCMVSAWYNDEGTVQVAQLLKASGLPMVDQACLQGVIGQRLEGMLPGEPGGRTYFRLRWIFDHKELDGRTPIQLDPTIPQLPAEGAIHPLPGYPADALAQHAHGICELHVTVSGAGAVSTIDIKQSTGSESLDEACKEAMYKSAFVPATNGERPVSGTTDVAILWRLPRS